MQWTSVMRTLLGLSRTVVMGHAELVDTGSSSQRRRG